MKQLFFQMTSLILGPLWTTLFFVSFLLFSLITFRPYHALECLGRIWARGMLIFCGIKLQVYGKEYIQEGKQYLVLANHQSLLDLFIIPIVSPHGTLYVGKKSILHVPVVGWIFAITGQIPIDRTDHESALESLKRAEEKISRGHSLFMAPEGTRSKDGTLGPFKKGAFHVAIDTHIPVLPITVRDSYKRLPKYRVLVKPGPVTVFIDPPIDTTNWRVDTLPDHMNKLRGIYLSHLE